MPKKVKFIKKSKPNIITMDLETRILNERENCEIQNVIPVCLSIYDGYKKLSFFISDYKSSDKMLISAINSILISKYNKYIVILHNFSYFDGILIFKTLISLGIRHDLIQKEGRLIDTKIYFGNKCEISFRDSYLMLPSSLDYIGKIPTNVNYYYVPDFIKKTKKNIMNLCKSIISTYPHLVENNET